MAPQLEIHVDGKGSVFRTAERGVIHLSISSTSTNQTKSFANVKDTVEMLTQKFRTYATKTEDGRPHPSAGITTFTLSPLSTSSYYQRDTNHREIKSEPKEHVVRSTAEVVFRNLKLLSDVSDVLATLPHVSIASSEWRLTAPTRLEIEREARVKAIKDAVQKAEDYAGVVGRQVVAVEIKDGPASNSVSHPYHFAQRFPAQAQMQMQQQQAPSGSTSQGVVQDGPSLEPRTISVSAQVNAKVYQLYFVSAVALLDATYDFEFLSAKRCFWCSFRNNSDNITAVNNHQPIAPNGQFVSDHLAVTKTPAPNY
ncbi:hypothetical protein O988_01774 [Pseudogymnoascus sp. VKM F-3808]|nr:hypothetical protein O988_01774 [Pseudogymnoascus sp. VKM F-3808]